MIEIEKSKLKDYSKLSESYHIDLLKKQANKRNGTIKPDVGDFIKYIPIPYRAQVIFPHNKVNVNVTTWKGQAEEPPRTAVSINIKLNQNIKLVVYFRNTVLLLVRPQYIGWIFRVKKIKTDNPIFDKEFVIKTNDETFALNLLNYEMQNRLLELANEKFHPILKITKKEILLIAGSILTEEKEYDKLIDTALLFFKYSTDI